ncbi:hypothetical protein DICSQDRAFT_136097 [Dichomitus squalens LYAD-421 SS1]|uniref:Uncharacterized protein n=2 Tax=Dichomitus squalens TaxID=114155 RepID=A0A4Q9PJF5_9APHY|nr:uncharacterized protein DICSQDRAFT_136097 [Dichomitus squalens LYAD-421 SS1]EJF61980.1 hypothetical protein DICSQDRAFT_136097 [Dichomitus squalens LYAD-421 SS1]TBU54230.1 hypothetical protein BD310DRAFT_828371 [Dichomitus squalens]
MLILLAVMLQMPKYERQDGIIPRSNGSDQSLVGVVAFAYQHPLQITAPTTYVCLPGQPLRERLRATQEATALSRPTSPLDKKHAQVG